MKHYETHLEKYIDFVIKGKVLVSKEIKRECIRTRNIIAMDDVELDIEECSIAVEWIERFCLLEDGKPIKLALWQKAFINSIFGIFFYEDEEVRDGDGAVLGVERVRKRLTQEVFLMVGSGNGKTALLSCINYYTMFGLGLNSPKLFIASNSHQQSKLCFDMTKTMLKKNKALLKKVSIKESLSEITIKSNDGYIRALSSKGNNHEGIKPDVVVFDEVHAFKDEKLVTDLKKNIVKNPNALMVEITTNGHVRGRYLDNRLDFLRAVTSERVDAKRTRAWIFEQDTKEEIFECINNAQKSNPQMGITISKNDLQTRLETALASRSEMASILAKNFNIPQLGFDMFFEAEECKTNIYDENELVGKVCVLGLDMALTTDLACLTFLTSDDEGNDLVKSYFFTHSEDIEQRSQKDKVDYKYFESIGELIVLDGNKIQEEKVYEFLVDKVRELQIKIALCGVDPMYASYIISELERIGGNGYVVSMNNAQRRLNSPTIQELKLDLSSKKIKFNSKLLEIHLAACVGNVDRNGDVTLIKKATNTRIDGAWSLVYARKAKYLYYKGGIR